MFASFFAWAGVGSVLGILFVLFMLIPVALYFIYVVCHIIYLWSYVLFTGIDPRTGKPPVMPEKNS